MLKRQASGTKPVRKRKKGNATYVASSLDPIVKGEKVLENVRVWRISSADGTGRVRASRKTVKHFSQVLPELPSTSKWDEGVADAEETGVLADSESPSDPLRRGPSKPKRVRTFKENDSVSVLWSPRPFELTCVSRQKWNSGSSIVPSFWTSFSVSMVWVMRRVVESCVPTA